MRPGPKSVPLRTRLSAPRKFAPTHKHGRGECFTPVRRRTLGYRSNASRSGQAARFQPLAVAGRNTRPQATCRAALPPVRTGPYNVGPSRPVGRPRIARQVRRAQAEPVADALNYEGAKREPPAPNTARRDGERLKRTATATKRSVSGPSDRSPARRRRRTDRQSFDSRIIGSITLVFRSMAITTVRCSRPSRLAATTGITCRLSGIGNRMENVPSGRNLTGSPDRLT